MKIKDILKEDINLNGIEWYHCGPDFDNFSTEFLGSGEGNHLLGYGVYFINQINIAKGYAKHVMSGKPFLYTVKLNATSDQIYNNMLRPSEKMSHGMNAIAKQLGYEDYTKVPYRHSAMKYGRGLPGVVFSQLGPKQGAQLLIQNGILGQYEDVGNGVYEIAVWDLSIIKLVDKEKLPEDESKVNQVSDPELDAWWDEMMKDDNR